MGYEDALHLIGGGGSLELTTDGSNILVNGVAIGAPTSTFDARGTGASGNITGLRNALYRAQSQGGGMVFAGDPLYVVDTSPLIVGTGVDLRFGLNTVITQAAGANLKNLVQTDNWDTLSTLGGGPGTSVAGATRFRINGGIYDGNKANNPSVATNGVGIFGYRYDVGGIALRNCKGYGIAAEWGGTPTYAPANAEPGSIGGLTGPMEAFWDGVRAYGNDKAGVYFNAPNDARLTNIFCAFNANASQAAGPNPPTSPNMWIGPKALACLLNGVHVWSGGNYGIRLDAAASCLDCHAEGAYNANVYVGVPGVRWYGGRVFYGPGWANSGYVGFKMASGSSIFMTGGYIDGCANGAFDFTEGSGGASYIDAFIYNYFNATVPVGPPLLYTGTPSNQITWKLEGDNFGANPYDGLSNNARIFLTSDRQTTPTSCTWEDDFLRGNVTSGAIGDIGWTKQGAGTVATVTGTIGHPGVVRLTTGAVASQVAGLSMVPDAASAAFTSNYEHAHIWIVKPSAADAQSVIRAGVFDDPTIAQPVNGIYFEKAAADTNWFGVCRAAGVETRVDTGTAVSVAFFTLSLRWRFVSGAIRWAFSVGVANEVEVTTNVPLPATALGPVCLIQSVSGTSRLLDVDYNSGRIGTLVR